MVTDPHVSLRPRIFTNKGYTSEQVHLEPKKCSQWMQMADTMTRKLTRRRNNLYISLSDSAQFQILSKSMHVRKWFERSRKHEELNVKFSQKIEQNRVHIARARKVSDSYNLY